MSDDVLDPTCIECGVFLDRDATLCRVCGKDNDSADEDAVVSSDEIDESTVDHIGEWSTVKHEIVDAYATEYTKILRQQKWIKRLVYSDGFAGSGVALDRSGQYVLGSALRALEIRPAFDEYHFIELNDRKIELLERLTVEHKNVQIHRGDCNAVLPTKVLPRCRWDDYARGLCLLDPYGLSVDYDVLRRIGEMGTVEIFFNFMVVGANRNVLWSNPQRVPKNRWPLMTKIWGNEEWRTDLYETRRDMFGDFERKVSNDVVVERYRQRLIAAGFKYVPKPIPMRNSTNATVYYLFFASPNATGNKIVEHIFRKYGQKPR